MSVAVFKPEIWSRKIQQQLETITGLRKHSSYEFADEIKMGTVLHIPGAVRPTVGTYVPGTDIDFTPVSGISQDLPIDQFKYVTQTYDDVDRVQSIKGVWETACEEMARELSDEANRVVADKIKTAVKSGVAYKDASDNDAVWTIAQESTPEAVTDSNALSRIDTGLTTMYTKNVKPTTDIWGEFTPAYYGKIREKLTDRLTNNVELAKKGIVGKYYNVNVTIENLLPKDSTGTGAGKKTYKLNILRTGKAVAYAEQLAKTEAGRHEKQFGDYIKSLLVFGVKVVRPDEMYVIKELVANDEESN